MSGRRSNREILTGGKKYVQKQQKKFGVAEVVFDKDSRQDYLTGFHKRKVQRQKQAQSFNKEQDRLARIEERKRIRDGRKEDLENQLKSFNRIVKDIGVDSDEEEEEEEEEEEDVDEEWDGFNDPNDKPIDENNDTKPKGILHRTEEYHLDSNQLGFDGIIDDDTTVLVESVDNPLMTNIQDISLEAKARANNVDLSKSDEVLSKSIKRAQNYAVTSGAKSQKERIKKKKFRYLTKVERKDRVFKEKSKKFKHDRGKDKGKDKKEKGRDKGKEKAPKRRK